MSWHFSLALGEAFLAATCSAGGQSAPLSGSPMPQAYLSPDRMTAFSRLSRFGMTFAPLTDDLGAAVLTWCQEASRARTSALPGKAQESRENEAACGPTWRASLAKFDPVSCSWKTAQLSLLGDSELSSVTWPRSGMTANGQCWELPTLGRRTNGRGYGSLLPTLTVCGNYNRKGASKTSGDGLATVLRRMPTLCARNFRYPGRSRMERTGGKQGEVLPQVIGGPLNPTWCEWFMGFPQGWTELRPLETGKSHSAPQPRGDF